MICHCGNHAWVGLTRGYVTFVSPGDDHILSGAKWYVASDTRGYITVRTNLPMTEAGRPQPKLSRVIANPASSTIIVDHIDGDPLNNRRENLRCCSLAENNINVKMRKGKAVPFKGVRKAGARFSSMISFKRKQHYLGTFDTPEEAYDAYLEASRRLHGEFGRPQ